MTDSKLSSLSTFVPCSMASCTTPGNGAGQDCALIGFPSTPNLAPTATQGTGTVTLSVGDFSSVSCSNSLCTLGSLDIANVLVGGSTPSTSPITMHPTTKVISYDTTGLAIVTFEVIATSTYVYGAWSYPSQSTTGTITVDPCLGATFTDNNSPFSPSIHSTL